MATIMSPPRRHLPKHPKNDCDTENYLNFANYSGIESDADVLLEDD
jgi:hypothetical protein